MRTIAPLAAAAAFWAGCAAAPFPGELTRSVDRSLDLAGIRAHPQEPGETEIEILSRPLGGGDVPERSDRTDGRFLVRSREFLDPVVYARGRRLSVLGTVTGRVERRLGELPYAYPVVTAEQLKLWPKDVPWIGGEYPSVPLDSPVVPTTR